MHLQPQAKGWNHVLQPVVPRWWCQTKSDSFAVHFLLCNTKKSSTYSRIRWHPKHANKQKGRSAWALPVKLRKTDSGKPLSSNHSQISSTDLSSNRLEAMLHCTVSCCNNTQLQQNCKYGTATSRKRVTASALMVAHFFLCCTEQLHAVTSQWRTRDVTDRRRWEEPSPN